ncbi:hypothetical protein RND81_10G172100 [Saponaria officinalis]|uniref:Sulfotransferase n=1 Tax=Saponaria officinalis TaxID=3572 RepID=A0AAW1I5V7_SAPOF
MIIVSDSKEASDRLKSFLDRSFGSPGKGIVIERNSDLLLRGYSDSDHARCPLTRRSLTGYFVKLGNSPISWKARKQTTVAKSSAEAEYRALGAVTSELKSLLYAVVNRHNTPVTQSPLLDHSPHELVRGLETDIYKNESSNKLDQVSDPRLLSTHLPYELSSKAKILHITRNPSDMPVSQYHFTMTMKQKLNKDFKPPQFEHYFNEFCEGRCVFGPYFDNVLEYWNTSSEQTEKVLFLKYKELKANPTLHLMRLAEFVSMPFSTQEESDGVVDDIIELCSFKNVKELEVNKSGDTTFNKSIEKKSLFRKGEVGDWTNYFTPLMVQKMDQLMQDHLRTIQNVEKRGVSDFFFFLSKAAKTNTSTSSIFISRC